MDFYAKAMSVLPPGIVAEEDGPDIEAVVFGLLALYRLYERSEQRNMARWVDKGNGRKTLDFSLEATPEEIAEADERVREQVAAGYGPSTPRWNPTVACQTTGFSQAQAEYLFPTKERWEGFCKANGKVIVGGSDLKHDGISRPSATPTTAAREEKEAFADDLLKRVAALLEKGAPVIKPEDVGLPVPASRNGTNGTHAPAPKPDDILRQIEGDGGLDEDPTSVIKHLSYEERPTADVGDLDAGLSQMMIARRKARQG